MAYGWITDRLQMMMQRASFDRMAPAASISERALLNAQRRESHSNGSTTNEPGSSSRAAPAHHFANVRGSGKRL